MTAANQPKTRDVWRFRDENVVIVRVDTDGFVAFRWLRGHGSAGMSREQWSESGAELVRSEAPR